MQTRTPYRKDDDHWLIELRLEAVDQFFNTLDPAPFHHGDLDRDAERYIVEAARELPSGAPLKLLIHLPGDAAGADTEARLRDTVHHYFDWEAHNEKRRLGDCLQEGRASLLIGTAFLFFCMLLRASLTGDAVPLWRETLAEGLLVIGWVAMWRPVDTFLYRWWPVRSQLRLLRRLATMPVSVRTY